MLRLSFLLFVLAFGMQGVQGQQVISSVGGVSENGRISCQLTLGELEVVDPYSVGAASIQLVSGTFSPSNGTHTTTDNELLAIEKPLVALTLHDRRLFLVQSEERETDCRIYSVAGKLAHHTSFRELRYEIMLHSLPAGIYFIRIAQEKQCQTYKLNIP